MIKSPIQFVYVCVCRNTQKKLRVFVGFVNYKFKFCCEFRSWMFLNHSKWITLCFDGLNIPSYLAYSTFLVITNRDFYGLIHTTEILVNLSRKSWEHVIVGQSVRSDEVYCFPGFLKKSKTQGILYMYAPWQKTC